MPNTKGMTPAEKLAFYSTRSSADACWEWNGAIKSDGYGHLRLWGRYTQAHRAMWQIENGSIPAGLFVCHKCDNRKCINPSHLFLGTNAENLADMRAKGRGRIPPKTEIGEKHPQAKFSDDVVLAVRADGRTQREIASHYGMSTGWVSYIKRGLWRASAGCAL